MSHHRDVFYSVMDAIYHHWRETFYPGSEQEYLNQINQAFDMQDESEVDDVDRDHYLDSIGG